MKYKAFGVKDWKAAGKQMKDHIKKSAPKVRLAQYYFNRESHGQAFHDKGARKADKKFWVSPMKALASLSIDIKDLSY